MTKCMICYNAINLGERRSTVAAHCLTNRFPIAFRKCIRVNQENIKKSYWSIWFRACFLYKVPTAIPQQANSLLAGLNNRPSLIVTQDTDKNQTLYYHKQNPRKLTQHQHDVAASYSWRRLKSVQSNREIQLDGVSWVQQEQRRVNLGCAPKLECTVFPVYTGELAGSSLLVKVYHHSWALTERRAEGTQKVKIQMPVVNAVSNWTQTYRSWSLLYLLCDSQTFVQCWQPLIAHCAV